MTNAEYYKNYSFDEVRDKFMAACPDKSKQTVQAFNEWCKAERCSLVKGDVIIRRYRESNAEVVVDIDEINNIIVLRPLSTYLAGDLHRTPTRLSYNDCELFTGKPICNISELIKDPSGKYHVIAKSSCPLVEPVKLSDLTDTPKANKSKKDKILDYMEKVMLIGSSHIDELRKLSVEQLCARTYLSAAYIFSVLYRVSPCKHTTLGSDFICECKRIAPKWLAVRKNCNCFKCINHFELIAMLDHNAVGYTGYNRKMYNINGEIV